MTIVAYIVINQLGNYCPCIGILRKSDGEDFLVVQSRTAPTFTSLENAINFIHRCAPKGAKKYLTPFIPSAPSVIWLSELGPEYG